MIVLDTTVLSYAAGGEHPLREPSRRIVDIAATGAARFTTTTEVVQEFAHVYSRRRPRAKAAALGRAYMDLLGPLVEVQVGELESGLRLFERYEQLGAFDAVLAAVVLNRRAEALISADSAFGAVPKLPFVALGSADLDSLLAER